MFDHFLIDNVGYSLRFYSYAKENTISVTIKGEIKVSITILEKYHQQ